MRELLLDRLVYNFLLDRLVYNFLKIKYFSFLQARSLVDRIKTDMGVSYTILKL